MSGFLRLSLIGGRPARSKNNFHARSTISPARGTLNAELMNDCRGSRKSVEKSNDGERSDLGSPLKKG